MHHSIKRLFEMKTQSDMAKARRRAPGPRKNRIAPGPAGGEETRMRLLSSGGELFAARGFDGVSVREICSRAKANVAAVAYHFGNKEGLYAEALRHGAGLVLSRIRSGTRSVEPDPVRRLERHVTVLANALLSPDNPAWTTRLMMRELASPTMALGRIVDEVARPNFDAVRHCIAQLLHRSPESRTVALHTFSVIGQCLHYRHTAPVTLALLGWKSYPTGFADQVAAHVVSVTLRALGYAPSGGEEAS